MPVLGLQVDDSIAHLFHGQAATRLGRRRGIGRPGRAGRRGLGPDRPGIRVGRRREGLPELLETFCRDVRQREQPARFDEPTQGIALPGQDLLIDPVDLTGFAADGSLAGVVLHLAAITDETLEVSPAGARDEDVVASGSPLAGLARRA